MSTSSSSDDYERFKEAVDPSFSDNLYKRETNSIEESAQHTKTTHLPKSLRHQKQQTHFNPLEIRVTPEFRSYVSKHLNKLLDKTIDYTEEKKVKKKSKSKNKIKGGVKLLRTSKNFVNHEETDIESCVSSKKKFCERKRTNDNESSDSDIERRAKEVAVTAEWILSGKATEGWVPCTRGEVEVITKDQVEK